MLSLDLRFLSRIYWTVLLLAMDALWVYQIDCCSVRGLNDIFFYANWFQAVVKQRSIGAMSPNYEFVEWSTPSA